MLALVPKDDDSSSWCRKEAEFQKVRCCDLRAYIEIQHLRGRWNCMDRACHHVDERIMCCWSPWSSRLSLHWRLHNAAILLFYGMAILVGHHADDDSHINQIVMHQSHQYWEETAPRPNLEMRKGYSEHTGGGMSKHCRYPVKVPVFESLTLRSFNFRQTLVTNKPSKSKKEANTIAQVSHTEILEEVSLNEPSWCVYDSQSQHSVPSWCSHCLPFPRLPSSKKCPWMTQRSIVFMWQRCDAWREELKNEKPLDVLSIWYPIAAICSLFCSAVASSLLSNLVRKASKGSLECLAALLSCSAPASPPVSSLFFHSSDEPTLSIQRYKAPSWSSQCQFTNLHPWWPKQSRIQKVVSLRSATVWDFDTDLSDAIGGFRGMCLLDISRLTDRVSQQARWRRLQPWRGDR